MRGCLSQWSYPATDESAKTPKADLEKKKSTWMLIGYVIVLAFMRCVYETDILHLKTDETFVGKDKN